MTTATMGMERTRVDWWLCDWTPGRARRFGKQAHVKYQDGSYIGSATQGPTDIEACLNVRNAAAHICRMMEQARVDFVIQRYRYYCEQHGQYTKTLRHAAVARDAGLTVYDVAAILRETYAYAA